MDIAPDTLNAPNTKYDVCVMMPSGEFARIIRDLSALGESVKIGVSRDGVSFSAEGEAGDGSVFLKQTESGQMRFKQEEGDEDKEEDSESDAKQRGAESFKLSKRSESPEDNDEYEGGVSIDMNQAVTLTFSLKYLVVFSKSASFSRKVQLSMSAAVPLRVSQRPSRFHAHSYSYAYPCRSHTSLPKGGSITTYLPKLGKINQTTWPWSPIPHEALRFPQTNINTKP